MHYVVTNREITRGQIIDDYHRKVNDREFIRTDGLELATDNLRFGTYTFNSYEDKDEFKIMEEPALEAYQTTDPKVVFPSFNFFTEIYESMLESKKYLGDVLVFIHGDDVNLESSLSIIRKLHSTYVERTECPIEHIILFSWPAIGNIFKYRNDARDAQITGYALGRALQKMAAFINDKRDNPCNQRIHIMAHSTGGQVLEAMLQQLLEDDKQNLTSLFHDVFLVGSDLDYDAFESPKPLYNLIDICQRVHVFYHKNDTALIVSRSTKNAKNKLGKCGVKNSRNLPDDVLQYDISHTKEDKTENMIDHVSNHWSHLSSSETVEKIIDILTDYQDD